MSSPFESAFREGIRTTMRAEVTAPSAEIARLISKVESRPIQNSSFGTRQRKRRRSRWTRGGMTTTRDIPIGDTESRDMPHSPTSRWAGELQ